MANGPPSPFRFNPHSPFRYSPFTLSSEHSLVRRRGWGENGCNVVGPVAVDLEQEVVGHVTQLLGERLRGGGGVRAAMLTDDRAHRVDMLVDERVGDSVEVWGVLDQPAQAVGRRRRGRIAEGRGPALDIVGGIEQG